MHTIDELAQICGVSSMTVSRAFQKGTSIKESTREKILAEAEKMNFTPNTIARSLRRARTDIVGILIPNIRNYFYVEMLQELEGRINRLGFRTLIHFMDKDSSNERASLQLMREAKVDALMIMNTYPEFQSDVRLLSEQLPVLQLFFGNTEAGDRIVIDDAVGTRLAAQHLIERGHRRIAYFSYGHTAPARAEIFREFCRSHCIDTEDCLISTDWIEEPEVIGEMLKKHGSTAVFVTSRMAEKAVNIIRRNRIRIPEDISLLVYDDSAWARMMEITVIAHPFASFAKAAVDWLTECTTKKEYTFPAQPLDIALSPFLISRQSVAICTEE